MNGLREHFQPVGLYEEILVELITATLWRMRRLLRAEAEENPLGQLFEAADGNRLFYLLRYGATLERSLDRYINLLERAQRMRLGEAVPPPIPPIDINVSSP